MLYDPRELAQELEEQGNTVQPGPGKTGTMALSIGSLW
jgi:hypothetical protein